jgi:hypothetical protein
MQSRNRLDVLSDLGKFMAVFGWVAVGLSFLIGIVSISNFAQGMGRQAAVIMGFLVIILGSLSGIMMAAMGHIIQLLVNSERGAPSLESQSSGNMEDLELPQPVS